MKAQWKKPRAKKAGKAKPKQSLTVIVDKLINRKAETKTSMFYGTATTFPQTGLYADRAYSQQNQFITTNAGDLKWLLPNVVQGIGDNQRIGEQISPISLHINGTVKVSLSILTGNSPVDIFAVVYVLTHKTYKNYEGLNTGNNFAQLLMNGQGATSSFTGNVWAARQPVSRQNYNVLAKKIVRLRYAGLYTSGGQSVSIANSHDYVANYNVVLTQKHMPKALKYPEADAPATAYTNSPTNYAPFMAVGFYWADGSGPAAPQALLESTYVTRLTYKDM